MRCPWLSRTLHPLDFPIGRAQGIQESRGKAQKQHLWAGANSLELHPCLRLLQPHLPPCLLSQVSDLRAGLKALLASPGSLTCLPFTGPTPDPPPRAF